MKLNQDKERKKEQQLLIGIHNTIRQNKEDEEIQVIGCAIRIELIGKCIIKPNGDSRVTCNAKKKNSFRVHNFFALLRSLLAFS